MITHQPLLETVLAQVAERLVPSDDLPSVRCVARPSLIALLLGIRDEITLPGAGQLSGAQLLEHLVRSRIAQAVPLDAVAQKVRSDRFYAVGLGVDPAGLDPLELLQAHVVSGVVCYFTALEVHGLTTQSPSHHHIARVVKSGEATEPPPASEKRVAPAADHGTNAPPLGSWQFTYQGVPYYVTNREDRYLRNTQWRHLNDRSRYRVTTLEQTLVDTMHRPMSCGGPAVVFEAWEIGKDRLSPDRLVRLLEQIGDPRLSRRVGYMLEQVDYKGSDDLQAYLHALQSSDRPADPTFLESLITGMPYTRADTRWGLLVP